MSARHITWWGLALTNEQYMQLRALDAKHNDAACEFVDAVKYAYDTAGRMPFIQQAAWMREHPRWYNPAFGARGVRGRGCVNGDDDVDACAGEFEAR